MLAFHCHICGDEYEVEDDLGGRTIRCRSCNELSKVLGPKVAPPLKPWYDRYVDTVIKVLAPKPPKQPGLPWYYRFLEAYASLAIVLGIVFCLGSGIVSLAMMSKSSAVDPFAVFFVVVFCLMLLLGIVASAAFVLLAMEAGHNLRAIRRAVEADRRQAG